MIFILLFPVYMTVLCISTRARACVCVHFLYDIDLMCVLIQMHKCKDHKECKLSDACAREPATRGGGAAGTKRKASERRSGREGVLAAP